MDSLANSEQCLVAMMLMDGKLVEAASAKVKPEDFGSDRLRKLYKLILDLDRAEPGAVDAVQVMTVIEDRRLQEELVDREGLRSMLASVPSTAYAETHVNAVLEGARRRRLSDALVRAQAAIGEGEKAGNVMRQLDEDLQTAHAARGETDLVVSRDADKMFRGQLQQRVSQTDGARLIDTPIPALTQLLGGGLSGGEMVIVAGRAAMGKSVFAECMAEQACQHGSVLYCSLEMTSDQMVQRAYQRFSEQPIPDARTAYGASAQAVLAVSESVSTRIRSRNIYYMDKTDVDFQAIHAAALSLRARSSLSLVVVDYIGLVREDPSARSRQEAVSSLSRRLKRMALSLKIPVIAVAQLNRELERRDDKRPKLSDLRESGALEQDADRVLAVHRPSYYDPGCNETDRIIVLKNRYGQTGEVGASFEPHRMRWSALKFSDHSVL